MDFVGILIGFFGVIGALRLLGYLYRLFVRHDVGSKIRHGAHYTADLFIMLGAWGTSSKKFLNTYHPA